MSDLSTWLNRKAHDNEPYSLTSIIDFNEIKLPDNEIDLISADPLIFIRGFPFLDSYVENKKSVMSDPVEKVVISRGMLNIDEQNYPLEMQLLVPGILTKIAYRILSTKRKEIKSQPSLRMWLHKPL